MKNNRKVLVQNTIISHVMMFKHQKGCITIFHYQFCKWSKNLTRENCEIKKTLPNWITSTYSYWSNLNANELSIFSLSKSMQHTGHVWQVIGWVPRITEQWMLVRGQCDWWLFILNQAHLLWSLYSNNVTTKNSDMVLTNHESPNTRMNFLPWTL